MRNLGVHYPCIHDDILSIEAQFKTIQAFRSRSVEPLTRHIVMRPMTGTLKAVAVITERYGAAQMDTTLIERNPIRAILVLDY